MSNIDRPRRASGPVPATTRGTPSSTGARPLNTIPLPAGSGEFPSPAGTAVLNLTVDQVLRIRILLVAMRLGKAIAEDVRGQIFNMLSGSQRRMLGAAYFIISVRA